MSNKGKREKALQGAQEMLAMAQAGLADVESGNPPKRRAGLLNIATYGRSVTYALQRLKNCAQGFWEWYEPLQAKMETDPLMKHFAEMRNAVLKRGEGVDTSTSTTFGGGSRPVDMNKVLRELARHEPPNTVGTFFGDPLGGDGWIVKMPNGKTEHVYFVLPGIDIQTTLHFQNPPDQHYGQPISDTSVEHLSRLYVGTLAAMVTEAVDRWGSVEDS